jgi:hypothetical protein
MVSPPADVACVGTVLRVEQPAGDFLAPRSGNTRRPLAVIFLRLRREAGDPVDKLVEVAVLDAHEPAYCGGPGDLVSFVCSGRPPAGSELAFEDLRDYTVLNAGRRTGG